MAGPLYNVRGVDPMLEDTVPEADWKNYFDNISLATQASCATSASTLALTKANMNTVMTVDNDGNVVPGDKLAPLVTPNDMIYDSGNDTLRIIARFMCGSFPVSDKIHGDGMGVVSKEGILERSNDTDRHVGMSTENNCICPDSLTAFTQIIKGYPAECLFPKIPFGHPTKGIGISIAEFPNIPDVLVGVKDATFDTYIVYFSRPYAHIPVVCINGNNSEVSVLETTQTFVRLRVHSGDTGLNLSFSLIAIGYIE